MSDKEALKQRILSLITMDQRRIDSLDEDNLMKTVAEVDQIRLDAVKDGRFLDADNAKKKLKQLRESLNKRKKTDIKTRQNVEINKLEEDFQAEVAAFSNHWADRIGNYQRECQEMERELLTNNRQALDEYRKYLEETLPQRPKDPAKILDLKAQLEQLVRQEEYKDAHYMQQRIYDLERQEVERYASDRAKKIDTLIDQKSVQQHNEYLALRKRVINGLDELELQRKGEHDRLFLKYQNIRKNIEKAQNMESYFLEKSIKSTSLQQSIRNYFSMPLNPPNGVKSGEELPDASPK
jgi:hypothetical protein